MKGMHRIKISNKKVSYDITVRRNITIIQGDSANGKTTLIRLIDSYSTKGRASGIKLECDKKCVVLNEKNWEINLENVSDSIVFIDEGNKFIVSKDFANAAKKSDNYYVIITREDLVQLPYSVNEIYTLNMEKTSLKNSQTYNEMTLMYEKFSTNKFIKPTLIITEDSNAGYKFFKTICDSCNIKCISVNGKSNIVKYFYDKPDDSIIIIADGASYGSEMRQTMKYIERYSNYVLYLPESFEWLVLKSGIVRSNHLENILSNPSDFIESKEFFSWERFFTKLLEQITEQMKIKGMKRYNKKDTTLPEYFKSESNMKKILEQLPSNIKFNNTSK